MQVNIWWFLDLTLHRYVGVKTAVCLVDASCETEVAEGAADGMQYFLQNII